MSQEGLEIYRQAPKRVESDIPIFSDDDSYNQNYAKIAKDHLAAQKQGIENPFIESSLWRAMEESIRKLIKNHVLPGCCILDVGVVLGRVIEPLPEFLRHGIDISFDYLGQQGLKE
jgi:hypothetical protein